MRFLLIILLLPATLSSLVCGTSGNFSSPSNWSTLSSMVVAGLPMSHPSDFLTTLAIYREVATMVETTDYWEELVECMEELVHRVRSMASTSSRARHLS